MIGKFGTVGLTYPNGDPAAAQAVTVVESGTNTPVDIYSDAAATPRANPVTTDAYGNLFFYAEEGGYDLIVNGARVAITIDPLASGGGSGLDLDAGDARYLRLVGGQVDGPLDIQGLLRAFGGLSITGLDPGDFGIELMVPNDQDADLIYIYRQNGVELFRVDSNGTLYLGTDLNIASALHAPEIDGDLYGRAFIKLAPQNFEDALDLFLRKMAGGPAQTVATDVTFSGDVEFTGTVTGAGGGGGAVLAYKPGCYYPTPLNNQGSLYPTTDQLRAYPIKVEQEQQFDRIACIANTTDAAASMRMGVYADNAGSPGDLILDAGSIDLGSGGKRSITIDLTLPAGIYWLAAAQQGAGGVQVQNMNQQPYKYLNATPDPENYGFSVAEQFTRNAAVSGALPAVYGAGDSGGANSSIAVFLRAAVV